MYIYFIVLQFLMIILIYTYAKNTSFVLSETVIKNIVKHNIVSIKKML